MNRLAALHILVGLLLACLLSGCVQMTDLEASQEQAAMQVGISTSPDEVIEQTFTSRRPQMNSLTLWLSSGGEAGDPAESLVEVALFNEPAGGTPLATQTFTVSGSGEQTITFEPLGEQPRQPYRVRIRSINGPVQVLGMDLDLYPGGTAYVQGQPLASDIAFRLTYDYGFASAGEDAASILRASGNLGLLAVMLLLPGWLILDFAGLRRRFDPGQRLALAIGLSLAVIPVVMLWTSIAGIRWNTWSIRFVFGLLGGLGLWRIWLRRKTPRPALKSFRLDWVHLGLIGVLAAGFFLRWAMVRDLSTPAWVDSVHHALITRLILTSGGFPSTYQPYFSMAPTEYHAGFHSGLAVYQWLVGVDPANPGVNLPVAMLIYGQVLNTLATGAVYLLAVSLTGSRRAGFLAAVIPAFFTPMPAYYASWGRYTQLAGLLILPAAFALLVKALHLPRLAGPKRVLAHLVPLAICGAGLVIVHYRAAIFFAILAGGYILSQIPFRRGATGRWARRVWIAGGIPAAGAVLLALPWVLPNISAQIVPGLNTGGGEPVRWFSDFVWSYLDAALGKYTLWIAAAGFFLALVLRPRLAAALLLWVAGMFFVGNLAAMRLPFGSLVSPSSVEIVLFMPVSVLAGYLIHSILQQINRWLSDRFATVTTVVTAIIVIGLSALGASRLLPIINPTTLLTRQADLQALAWLDANIPAGETVLINPFNWGYGAYAGRDGGYWISPVTGRQTIPPPVLYGYGDPAAILETIAASQQTEQTGGDPEALWQHMQSLGVRYVYIGARGGPVRAQWLSASPRFELLYSHAGTFLFHTVPPPWVVIQYQQLGCRPHKWNCGEFDE